MSTIDETAFAKLFDERSILLDLTATTRDETVAALVAAAGRSGKFDAAHETAVREAVLAREALGSTGIGGGIAIPHAKTDHVQSVVTAVAVARTGIDFKAVDGEACTIFFLVLSPKAQHEQHLAILRWLSRLKRNADFTRFLRSARAPKEVVSLIEEMGS